jgi:hypothetical protein
MRQIPGGCEARIALLTDLGNQTWMNAPNQGELRIDLTEDVDQSRVEANAGDAEDSRALRAPR